MLRPKILALVVILAASIPLTNADGSTVTFFTESGKECQIEQGCTEAGCQLFSNCPVEGISVEKLSSRATLTEEVKHLLDAVNSLKKEQLELKSRLASSESNNVKLIAEVANLEALPRFTKAHEEAVFGNQKRGIHSANDISGLKDIIENAVKARLRILENHGFLGDEPTKFPTAIPTSVPTSGPTHAPTPSPTLSPTPGPTLSPTLSPTPGPTLSPTAAPSLSPTASPTKAPTAYPTAHPCDDGTHGCDSLSGGGICYEAVTTIYEYENHWLCDCANGYDCTAGCQEPYSGHKCVLASDAHDAPPTQDWAKATVLPEHGSAFSDQRSGEPNTERTITYSENVNVPADKTIRFRYKYVAGYCKHGQGSNPELGAQFVVKIGDTEVPSMAAGPFSGEETTDYPANSECGGCLTCYSPWIDLYGTTTTAMSGDLQVTFTNNGRNIHLVVDSISYIDNVDAGSASYQFAEDAVFVDSTQPITYTHYDERACAGRNEGGFHGVITVAECQALCDAKSWCASFEMHDDGRCSWSTTCTHAESAHYAHPYALYVKNKGDGSKASPFIDLNDAETKAETTESRTVALKGIYDIKEHVKMVGQNGIDGSRYADQPRDRVLFNAAQPDNQFGSSQDVNLNYIGYGGETTIQACGGMKALHNATFIRLVIDFMGNDEDPHHCSETKSFWGMAAPNLGAAGWTNGRLEFENVLFVHQRTVVGTRSLCYQCGSLIVKNSVMYDDLWNTWATPDPVITGGEVIESNNLWGGDAEYDGYGFRLNGVDRANDLTYAKDAHGVVTLSYSETGKGVFTGEFRWDAANDE